MKLTINGKDAIYDKEGLKTLKDLLDAIEGDYSEGGHVIIRVALNEEEIDEGQEIGLGGFPINDIESLEIETRNKLELAQEALEDAQEYLPVCSAALEQDAAMIREGNIQDGLRNASRTLELIGAFGEVLDGIRSSYRIDFSQVKVDDSTLLEKLLMLNQLADKILNSVKNEEWTEFADLMEYELSPLLFEWMAIIPDLIRFLPKNAEEPEG